MNPYSDHFCFRIGTAEHPIKTYTRDAGTDIIGEQISQRNSFILNWRLCPKHWLMLSKNRIPLNLGKTTENLSSMFRNRSISAVLGHTENIVL